MPPSTENRTLSPMAGDHSAAMFACQPALAMRILTVSSSDRANVCAARPTTSPPSHVTIMSRLQRSHGMRNRHEAASEPRTLVSQPHQGQGNSKLMLSMVGGANQSAQLFGRSFDN